MLSHLQQTFWLSLSQPLGLLRKVWEVVTRELEIVKRSISQLMTDRRQMKSLNFEATKTAMPIGSRLQIYGTIKSFLHQLFFFFFLQTCPNPNLAVISSVIPFTWLLNSLCICLFFYTFWGGWGLKGCRGGPFVWCIIYQFSFWFCLLCCLMAYQPSWVI